MANHDNWNRMMDSVLKNMLANSLMSKARHGDLDAAFHLGWCYFRGFGVKKDLKKAAEVWNRAALGGHLDAANRMAWCYYDGIGTEQDIPYAVHIWDYASDAGHRDARENLAWCRDNLSSDILKVLQPADEDPDELMDCKCEWC